MIKLVSTIQLNDGKVCFVDTVRLPALQKFKWRAVKARRNWYAKTTIHKNGKRIDISMHRFIARTKFGEVCHHHNSNSLDNRKSNLQNMSKREHDMFSRLNNIKIIYAPIACLQTEEKPLTPTSPHKRNY